MNLGHPIFAQIMAEMPWRIFDQCVERYHGQHKVRSFSCRDQFLTLAFAQLTGQESLREIESGLRAFGPKLYHAGFRSRVTRNTLAHANEVRDCRIWADLVAALMQTARPLYAGQPQVLDLEEAVYALDSTTIHLCLSLFPWAFFRPQMAAVKVHTQLEVRSSLPTFVRLTTAKVHDVNILDALTVEAGAFFLVDRGYLDFARLYTLHRAGAYFIIRARGNLAFRRRYSLPVDKSLGLVCDQRVLLKSFYPARDYPELLRRIRLFDYASGKTLIFLTNNTSLPAGTITELYRQRWRVEIFFKWIKGHLRIKRFYGTSENAVYTQIWVALSVFLLIAILKARLGLPHSLAQILHIIDLLIFEKIPLFQALTRDILPINHIDDDGQLFLFDL
jgi:hypothetical protein